MELFITPRQGGKSSHLINWVRSAPGGTIRILVAHSEDEAMRLYRSTWDEDGNPTDLESWQFISWEDATRPRGLAAVRRLRPDDRIEFAIDNADLILSATLKAPGAAVRATWTSDGLRVGPPEDPEAIQTILLTDAQPQLTTHLPKD